MTIDMSQFFQVFFDETEELLAEMEKLLLAIDVQSPDEEDLNAIFRAAHSIKGGAGTFGLNDLTEVTHVLESLLDKIRKGEMALTAEHVDAFLVAKDILKMQLDGHRLQTPVDQDAVADARMTLQSLSQDALPPLPPEHGMETPSASAVAPDGFTRHFRIELPKIAPRDADALVAELGLLGHIDRTAIDGERTCVLLATNESADDIVAICSFVLDPSDLKITEQAAPKPAMTAAEAKAAQEEAQGYGFFEPLENEADLAAAAKAAQEEKQGYGFFEPFEPPALKEAQEAAAAAVSSPAGAAAGAPFSATEVSSDMPGTSGSDKKATARKDNDRAAGNQESSSIRVG
ncbi:MAG TPA: Hpt domain-containing protein, partial [Noviherbaspirillum sp.]|uniref:Hpt domain-containing protein n=1 Tax=Noviherbaspirillum sp. TaxID=1926288 RepID=UPI002DDCD991